ncbi:MAG: hypothetical protein M1831_004895 [Alyxoria varia]|nr:MAG: hypothetical protein M1831_004895 [Alyxoria varia]
MRPHKHLCLDSVSDNPCSNARYYDIDERHQNQAPRETWPAVPPAERERAASNAPSSAKGHDRPASRASDDPQEEDSGSRRASIFVNPAKRMFVRKKSKKGDESKRSSTDSEKSRGSDKTPSQKPPIVEQPHPPPPSASGQLRGPGFDSRPPSVSFWADRPSSLESIPEHQQQRPTRNSHATYVYRTPSGQDVPQSRSVPEGNPQHASGRSSLNSIERQRRPYSNSGSSGNPPFFSVGSTSPSPDPSPRPAAAASPEDRPREDPGISRFQYREQRRQETEAATRAATAERNRQEANERAEIEARRKALETENADMRAELDSLRRRERQRQVEEQWAKDLESTFETMAQERRRTSESESTTRRIRELELEISQMREERQLLEERIVDRMDRDNEREELRRLENRRARELERDRRPRRDAHRLDGGRVIYTETPRRRRTQSAADSTRIAADDAVRQARARLEGWHLDTDIEDSGPESPRDGQPRVGGSGRRRRRRRDGRDSNRVP